MSRTPRRHEDDPEPVLHGNEDPTDEAGPSGADPEPDGDTDADEIESADLSEPTEPELDADTILAESLEASVTADDSVDPASVTADPLQAPARLSTDPLLVPEPLLPDDVPAARDSAEQAEGAPVPSARVGGSGTRWSQRNRERERNLLRRIAELPEDDPERIAARDEVVRLHLPLAGFLARRFRDRGESLEDLEQVATIGLLKAVDRFDIDRGVEFSTFATPTMTGEIKRHFRDKGWAIRVPRRLQELRISISRATAELSQASGHSPTVQELAEYLGVTEDDILEGLESSQAYATLSLDASTSDGEDSEGSSLVDTLGGVDPSMARVEARETINPLLAGLPPRERRIVEMRFYENLTQSQIAERVGVSQMHVSRLLSKSLAQMRRQATD
jgi:RNA polymerase sigma-B factor